MEKPFKSSISQVIAFTLLAQVLTVFITQKFYLSPLIEETYEPFGQTIQGAVANSIPLIITVFIFGIFIALFVRLRRFNLIKIFLTSSLVFATFSISFILFAVLFPDSVLLPFLLSALVIVLILLATYSKRFNFLAKPLSLFIGAETGAYFATILLPPTIYVLPLIMAAYDIYAVFAGPLKKIIGKPSKFKKSLKKSGVGFLSLLIVDFDLVKIGLGDIVFYSMLPASAFMISGVPKMLFTALATNIGVVLTLYLLKKKKIPLPGLPIPMLFGVLALLLL